MKRFSAKRHYRRFKIAFLSPAYVKYIHWTGCVVTGCARWPIHACHRIARYPNGKGTWQDIFGACWFHHGKHHELSSARFEEEYEVDLEAACARLVMEWKASTKPRGTATPLQPEDV